MPEQIKLKGKYKINRPGSNYKSKHNDGTRRRTQRRKITNDKLKAQILASQPRVTMMLLPSGKIRFVREPATQE
jgi:hypothetical protein